MLLLLQTMLVLLTPSVISSDGMSFPNGIDQVCSNEGEEWSHNMPSPCYTCKCKDGFVECEKKEQCPNEQGCYMLQETSKDSCCQVCRGCVHQGVYHASGSQWKDPTDPCRVFTCKAGVATESNIQCYTPCPNPIPPSPSQCCAVCPGCRINGQEVAREKEVTIPEDPCLKCHCENGLMSCTKEACPVLHCPKDRIFSVLGQCCQQCNGSRRLIEPPKGSCMLGSAIHLAGKSYHLDRCTHCVCQNGTSVCRRTACPVLDCPPEKQLTTPGHCCPHCPLRWEKEFKTTCTVGGHTYENEESWQLDPCKSCVCHEGEPRCVMEMCPHNNVVCPPNYTLMQESGQCCARCVESDGVCTVFGDPHYRTFDGKLYSFQGSCKYLLTADCVGHTFNIRVTNNARTTKTSSWTKTISIKVGEIKVNLGQKMRVKLNGKRIEPPYSYGDHIVINKTDDSIVVYTKLGIKILWDGNSFLEVSAPTSYKGKLCGLCGNFNNKKRDDFANRQGRLVSNPEKFGLAWRVGGKKACTRPQDEFYRGPQCVARLSSRFDRDSNLCKKLRKSSTFGACHGKVHPTMYIESCMVDMCECPNGRCYCESFTAYAHECQRLGVNLMDWRRETHCPSGWTRSMRPYPLRLH